MHAVLRFIRGVNPLGPIFTKELRSTARRKRTYVLRFVYLGVLLLCLLFFHLATGTRSDDSFGSVAARAQHNAELGQIFFAIFSFFSLAMMGLLGPVLTCTAVNSERLHKTLPVLLMTPITSWQILGGKLFSRLLIAFTLLGLSLPALAVVRLLGGVEVDQIAASLSISITTVIFSAAVGLFFSTLMNRAYAVVILAYGLCAVLWGVLPLIVGLCFAAAMPRGGPPWGFFEYLALTTPWFSMALQVIPERPPFRVTPWYWGCLLHLGLAVVLLLWSGLILRRMARKENDGSNAPAATAAPVPPAPTAGAAEREPGSVDAPPAPTLAYAGPATRTAPQRAARDVGDNPVLWRESRRPLVTRRWQKVLSVVLVVGLLLLLYVLLALQNDYRGSTVLATAEPQMGFASVFCGLFTVLTCIIAATAIATEKESDTWTLLLATPLSAAQIVRGKFVGILRRLMWPAILVVGHFLAFTLTGVIHPGAFATVVVLTLGTNLLFVATGLYLSLRLRTVTFAVILNLLIPVTLYLGSLLICGIAGFLVTGDDDHVEAMALVSPYVYMVESVEKLDDSRWRYNQQVYPNSNAFQRPMPWLPIFKTVDWNQFTLAVACVLAGHLALAWVVLSLTTRAFDRIVGRASQTAALAPAAGTGLATA